MRVINDAEVGRLLEMKACIAAIEAAFRARGEGRVASSSVAGLELDGGGLHAKLGRLDGHRAVAAVKVNANFPANPTRHGLPTIQGVVVLLDASCGRILAVMESPTLTAIRTAAASAVAANYLARNGASSAGFIGCGVQARAHIEALMVARSLTRVAAFDLDRAAANGFAADVRSRFGLTVEVAADVRSAARDREIVVTSTPSQRPILFGDDVSAGTFIAAVGADNERKQEIDPALLKSAIVVVDDLAQCSHIGDLHHALAAGVVTAGHARGTLDQIVTGQVRGRANEDEIVVFDSTGVAIEDVAAAALVYERAEQTGVGVVVS